MRSKPFTFCKATQACGWLLVALSFVTTAGAQHTQLDTKQLTRDNFYKTLEPLAKAEGKLVLYNFAGNWDPIWKRGLIPRFEARYGVKVEYHNVRKDAANQQLIAVHKTGQRSPADVYFAGGPDNFEVLNTAGVVARYKLSSLLPNLADVAPENKDVVLGIDTGGTWPLVHRSQLVIAYDSAALQAAQMPKDFDELLAWARRNPRKFAITAPGKGGSGSAFLYSAALRYTTDMACKQRLHDVRTRHEELVRWASTAACLEPVWTYLAELTKVSELTNGNADTLNLLNNRQVLAGTSWEDLVVTFLRGRQLPDSVRSALLAPALVSGGDGMFIPANARSPAAALLFVDMAVGHEFQTWKFSTHASRPVRADVAIGAVDAQSQRWLVPAEQLRTASTPANWVVSRALAQVFEDKVLARR
jgi:ABC-type uncharacterized transport system YnjBCD substrate-binding protein